jgi:lysophospholipase L1-like esterase
MKSFLFALLVLTLTFTAVYVVAKLFIYPPFGPLAIVVVAFLSAFSILLSICLSLIKRGKTETILKIGLVIGAVFLTYAVTEAIASYILIKPVSAPILSDPYRHHKFVTKTRSQFRGQEYQYTQTINNLGFRGPDINLTNVKDRYRILMLGDSFTMGKGVSDDQTFSALLEKSLNKDHKVQVFNAGVDSYAPILSYFQLTKDLPQLKSDLVILNLDMSDLIQEAAYRKKAVYGANGEILGIEGRKEDSKPPLRTRFRDWVDQHLYITRTIFFFIEEGEKRPDISIRNVVISPNFVTLRHTLADDSIDRTEQWENLFSSILKIKQYCDKNGMQFLLTIYPWGHQVNDKEWIPGRFRFIAKGSKISDKSIHTIEQLSKQNGIELLNVFPAFRSYSGSAPLYYSIDMHWTEAGHQIMARELEEYIRQKYLSSRENK